jgi:hypothetical protein
MGHIWCLYPKTGFLALESYDKSTIFEKQECTDHGDATIGLCAEPY